jgi:mRNA interferase RelE/StbE
LKVELTETAGKQLGKLDAETRIRILRFLLDGVQKLGEFWRYRVGDFRIICRIEDARLVILVLRLGHRREIYR